jgi:NAD(P)-dependent dehydrogenase (short-subunit alcohol dehydrogenase family)
MAWTAEEISDQTGRTAIVTGANSGIGLVAARELAGKGAVVVVACRDTGKGDAAVEQMRQELGSRGPEAEFEVRELDLADLDSVRAFAGGITNDYPDGIDLLINNAGVMAPPRKETADGFELQFGTNHLGHFALTGLLLDSLKKVPGSRVVTVSSNAHKMGNLDFDDLQREHGYRRWSAYGQSKLANLVFALDLQKRLAEADLEVESMAAHPGYSTTNLQGAGTGLGNDIMALISKPLFKLGDWTIAQDAEAGALPTLYAATVPDLAGGSYIGPDGFGEQRGAPTIVDPRRKAKDTGDADRLWQVSTDLTGVEYDFGASAL